MKLVSITYTKKPQFDNPDAWFRRIRAYMGVLEELGKYFTVISIDRINFSGDVMLNGVCHHFPDFGDQRFLAPFRLNMRVKKRKPDVVLVQGMIFPLQVILLRAQLGRKVKIIVQNHSEKIDGMRRRWLQRAADPF